MMTEECHTYSYPNKRHSSRIIWNEILTKTQWQGKADKKCKIWWVNLSKDKSQENNYNF